jgi:pyridoxal phosphate enzyme (YggS family)
MERIEKACDSAGRDKNEIRLMGVSKFHGAAEVTEAIEAGLTLFGENRVQEAKEKFPQILQNHPETELHMIGPLQRNKAKAAASLFACVQSLDRDEIVRALGQSTAGEGKVLDVLFELHTGEESKTGYGSLDTLSRGIECAMNFPSLKIRGLMTMAPFTDDRRAVAASFKTLYEARETLKRRFPQTDFCVLSMGMSGDFEIAIAEGATLLRIGTSIFGERR